MYLFRRAGDGRNLHLHRVTQPLGREFANFVRHGRRKHQRLPATGHASDDAPQIVDEPHVEHLIRFVENQNLDAGQVDMSLVHQVE